MAKRRLPDRYDGCALVVLAAVTLLFYWPVVTPDISRRASFPAGDFYEQFYSISHYEHERLWSGELPLWNPYMYGGHPFLADLQPAVFYPPGFLALLLSGPQELTPQSMVVEAVAHVFLGAVFTYLLVRRLTAFAGVSVSAVAAVLAALTFSFGGYLTSYPPLQLPILETQVWLPLILLLLDVGCGAGRWPPVLAAGVVWGMALLAGNPQSAMYVLYAALAYGLFRAFQSRQTWTRSIAMNLIWVLVGVGIAAVQVLPAWELARLSVRMGMAVEELRGGFALRDLVQVALPGVFTYWSPMYVGISALLMSGLACLGAFSAQGRSFRAQVVFWGLLALTGVLLSLGGRTFLYPLFYRLVPGFKLFRSQERVIFVTSLALSVLTGYGWAWISSIDVPTIWVRRARMLALSMGVLSVGAVVSVLAQIGFEGVWFGASVRWLGLSWVAWALLYWLRHRRRWWVALSVLLVVADLLVVNRTTQFAPGPADAHVLDASWLETVTGTKGLFRIVNDFGLPGNAGCWFDLENLSGVSPLRLQAHKVMIDAVPRWRMWQLFDVRYVATWEHDLPGPFSSTRVAMQGAEWEKDTVYVHRLALDFPRAWIVHRARTMGDLDALGLLSSEDFDPFDEVLLAASASEGTATPTEPSVVRAVAYAPEEVTVWAELSTPGWLVLGEWFYPGWQVRVDGAREDLLRANFGQRAVALEAGSHEVVFRYRPVSVVVGGTISIFTVLCVVVFAALRLRSSRFRAIASRHP